jgi:hypothetical protein
VPCAWSSGRIKFGGVLNILGGTRTAPFSIQHVSCCVSKCIIFLDEWWKLVYLWERTLPAYGAELFEITYQNASVACCQRMT